MSGAWGCFDEFNRLKQNQLSSITQQIKMIQNAIYKKLTSVNLLNNSIPVDLNSGIFVTLNPVGKGYGGRSRIPTNLKALFRPISMSKPHNHIIAETTLITEGFNHANILGQKIACIFLLFSNLMSKQLQYDWGLRSLKSVLKTSSKIFLTYKDDSTQINDEVNDNKYMPSVCPIFCLFPHKNLLLFLMHHLTKEYAIVKALQSTINAKLTPLDCNIFDDLLRDIFSRNVVGKNIDDSSSERKKDETMLLIEKDQFISIDQKRKIYQLYESLCQRTGCMIMGPSGSCKSFLWKTLRDILNKSGNDVNISIINPKSMNRRDLFGSFDCDTHEWIDGVLTRALRKPSPDQNSLRWIIFDGDIDPEWIEALNSALDDNKLLTLPNGERVSLGDKTSFIFETDSY